MKDLSLAPVEVTRTDETWPVIEEHFYIDPKGDYVWRWADEHLVLVDGGALRDLIEQLEAAREAVQACYDDLQRYAPPHWRNQGRGEILAQNFLASFPASEPK